MKKYIMMLICLLILSALIAEPINVAIGSFEKKDRDSDYIVNALLKRDFKNLFKENPDFKLMDIKKTEKKIKDESSKEFVYLKKDEKLEVAKKIGTQIIIWGDATAAGGNNFRVTFNILSVDTEEFISTVIEVPKNTKERIAVLQEKLICELEKSCENPNDLLLGIAMQQYSAKNYNQATESFLAVLGNDPVNVQAFYYLGAISYIEKDYEKALEYFQKAHENDMENDDITNQLSVVYTKLEMYEEAVATLELLSDYEENPLVWMRIGALYKNIEYYTEAQEAYENVIALTDTLDEAYLELGNLLYDLDYYDEALPYLEEAGKRYPDNDQLAKNLAKAYKKTGKIESAIQQYKELIADNPDNLRAYYNLANAYTSINDYEKALETANQLKDKDPESPNVYILLANSYSTLGNFDKAEQAANKILELDAENYNAYRILAEIYQGKGYIHYDKYLDYDKKQKDLYGTEADEMIEKRDSAKEQAHEMFLTSQKHLENARARTSLASERNYINEREKTIKQLLDATKKSFF